MYKKKVWMFVWIAALVLTLGLSPSLAKEFLVFDHPLSLLGYATQGAAFGMHNSYDTEAGSQAALMNLFVEGEYRISPKLKFYSSIKYTQDWAYQINAGRESWNDKLFDKSKDHLNVDGNYWQIMNEAHVTLTPGNFFFRVGKQIVSWGEMDGFRLMDQINPLDSRRGFGDVEFENTIIPIWLLRTEYYPRISTGWLQDMALEFVFNPNADFIPNQDIFLGNNDAGIWAPMVKIDDPTVPRGSLYLGSTFNEVHKPSKWSREGFEYAFRVKAVIKDTIITLNYFYGLENSPILKVSAIDPLVSVASDGRLLLHLFQDGKFPLFRYVGVTATRDIPFLKSAALGGVAPVFRFETFYAFSDTFLSPSNTFEKSDELRSAFGLDWKIKVPLLNPRAYFSVSPQVYYRRLMDLPPGGVQFTDTAANLLKRNNWQGTLFLSTTYFNAKLVPSFFWLRDFTGKGDFFRIQTTYAWSNNWLATVGVMLLDGKRPNVSFQAFDNKDNVFFKITYKWG